MNKQSEQITETQETAMAYPVLALRGVEQTYGKDADALEILNGVDFDLYSGEMVGLVAPSGTGKSTLLHIAGLLERPSAGEVYIRGEPCDNLSDAKRTALRRKEIGVVYQFHHLLPEFSALENIMLPQMIGGLDKKEARSRAAQLLSYMRLPERGEHRPSELSGGEQQRVAIARAVANGPAILLADEPTGNLDPKTSQHVFTALKTLVQASGLAALIVTHNMELAAQMDRCVTLHEGQLVPIG